MPDARPPSGSEISLPAVAPPAGTPPASPQPAATPSAAEMRTPPVRPGWRRSGDLGVRLVVLVAAGAVATLFATQWDRWVGDNTRQVTDDAYIRGDITPLSAKVEGYIRRVA